MIWVSTSIFAEENVQGDPVSEIENRLENKQTEMNSMAKEFDSEADRLQELQNEKSLNNNFNKESISNQKENENEISSTFNNKKEKNIITVELTDNEKIVFSQLGINPLLKLGKEYLTSNNIVRLENQNNKEPILKNEKKSKIKESKTDNNEILKSNSIEEIKKNSNKEIKDKDTLTKSIDHNQEVLIIENENVSENQIESTDEVNNLRKKRRRSSASIE